ncbi:MAG: hypothetical protein K2J63_12240 [Muribaculaceae bacterium]|nr:hypothetical protein [Muribaculaceae bacterium]
MKKIALYGLAAMFALSFAACDDYKEPNPAPQTNPQESLFKASDVTVSGDLNAGVYDLTELQAAGESITVATVKAVAELPAGCTLGGDVEISADDFVTSYSLSSSAEKVVDEEAYNVLISPAELEDIYFNNISTSPDEKEIKVRVLAKAIIGKQEAIIGGPTDYAGPYTMKVKPEVRYAYLYTPGATNDWNQAASRPLYCLDAIHYSGYAVLGGEFKFSDAPNWDGTNYGEGEEPGTLSTDGGNLSVSPEGLYWCTANVEELTYTTYYVSTIGVIGDATPDGWNGSTALTSDNYLVWKGVVAFGAGEFKFRANDDWAVNLGGKLTELSQGGDNIPSPGEGTYEVTLDLSQIPYTCTLVKQ